MKNIIVCLTVLLAGCFEIDTTSTHPAALEDKVEIDPEGMTTCDSGSNDSCFSASENAGKCPDANGKYSGTCWCTHCEGGNVCETEADHMAHDNKCELTPAES